MEFLRSADGRDLSAGAVHSVDSGRYLVGAISAPSHVGEPRFAWSLTVEYAVFFPLDYEENVTTS